MTSVNLKPIVGIFALCMNGVSMAEPTVMNAEDVAAWLKVSRTDVEAMATRGDLPGRLIGSAGWRFDAQALRTWLAGAQAQAASGEEATAADADDPERKSDRPAQEAMPKGRSAAPSAEETALRELSLVGKTGSITVDLSVGHSFDDSASQPLSFFGGRAESDTTTATVGLSYRLSERTELFANMPYVSQRSRAEDLAAGEVVRTGADGIQTVSVGMRRVLLSEEVGRPQVVGTVEATAPLQSGLRKRLGLEISVLKSLDPVTVFATLRAERAFGENGNDAGSRVVFGLGHVFALNDQLAVSTALNIRDEDAADATGLGWHRQRRYELKLGMPTSFSHSGWFLEPHVAFGLNRSNSAVSVGLSLVKTFVP